MNDITHVRKNRLVDLFTFSHDFNKESGKLGSTSQETARFTMPCAAPLIWSGSFLMGHAPPFLESSSPRYYHTHTDFYSL